MRHCWGTMTMPHTRYGQDLDRSRNMQTRNRRLGPLVQHPPPLSLGGITPQQADNQHTTTRKEAASTSLHKTRDLTHPLRGIAPVTWRCTRYAALHPNRRGAMPTDRVHNPRHKLTCGPTRKDVHGPDRLGWARRRSPNSRLGPAAQSKQPARPSGAVQTAGWARRHQTAGSARERQGLTGLRDDEPSQRLASQTTSGPPSERLASLAQHKARARGTHATSPGAGRAYDEAGTRRAKQRRGPRPRQ